MKVKIVEVIVTVPDFFDKGQKFIQSFADPDMFYPENSTLEGAMLDMRMADRHKGREHYFKEIDQVEHKSTPLFAKVKKETEERLIEVNKQLASLTLEKQKLEAVLE